MAEELTILDGSTFFVSDLRGDVDADGASGFFHDDMRHLSRWQLLIGGEPIELLTSRPIDYYSARIVGTTARESSEDASPVSVRRERFVADGVHEDLFVENHTEEERRVEVELRFGSDFGDIFECKTRPKKQGACRSETADNEVTLWYERDGYRRGTKIGFSAACEVADDHVRFQIKLGPRERWKTCIDISPVVDGEERGSRHRCGSFGKPEPNMPLSLEEWLGEAPELETDWDPLRHVCRSSLLDLAALRFRLGSRSWSLPAGGLPWFMTLFGRDSLLTAYQALPFHPKLAQATLEALAELQADEYDDFRDADPGKIPHELRRGELAALGDVPHDPYFGSHDATPLFLIVLDEYERWTGDAKLVRELEPAARAALAWIEGDGDRDGDGFLEYSCRSPKGLRNQGWKDSENSIVFADGRMAEPPIATCEIQGYAYDARRRAARLARDVWGDEELAERLERDAEALKERFERTFWIEERGHHALALDGDGNRVDSLTSNVGHLLWSGIVSEARAAQVVERLTGPAMFTGFGIRTMSSEDAGFNPLGYHNGTVWPFDTALVAEGMRRYGFREEAAQIAFGLLEAAAAFAYRLPECFAGFARDETGVPVEYPDASRPQAFSAGAPLLLVRTMLGLDAVDGAWRFDSHLPPEIRELALTLMH